MRLSALEGALHGLDRMAERNDTSPAHLRAGMSGEDAAYFYLRRKGYTVVARRWWRGGGRRTTWRATWT